ncbi:HAMP domain-containing histidine kinase [Brumimicrobium glaciale]|uniref:histidine kinase n=1 Tax=Brumimicrobium glaciale TaxID=200475 RepID=A0A4Q4KQ46_9FLAO|nr:HAMP domain-containing sensor histidine kinase [Brumimicrobium glaciale]RYM34139.1 HAMP domain-containing histidine kinase [Brumimicrobium glaciale]
MKLLNRSLIYLSAVFFIIIGVWSVIFYFNLKDEIRDSIDDGIDNNRLLILIKVHSDSTLLTQNEFGGNNFKIHPVSKEKALAYRDVFKDTMMYRLNENDLEPVRLLNSAFEHNDQYYRITVISSLVEEDDLIEDSFWSVVSLFIILVVSIIIVNNFVLRKIWNPFYDILNQLKTYRLDKNEKSIEINSNIKEFIQLQEAANTLINRSKEAFLSQKEFTENASHELQTPIAIIIGKLELLLESKDLKDEDANTIANVINIADRLKRLNNSLLLLAKIENKQFLEEETISLNETAKNLLSNYDELLAFKQIEYELDETKDLKVKMNPALADILLSNLIKNAIFHNKKDGNIRLTFTSEEFIVCNTGNPFSLNPDTIFNRFEKDQTKKDSTGLGLSISIAICNSYNLKINYGFAENQHCFKINFNNILAQV